MAMRAPLRALRSTSFCEYNLISPLLEASWPFEREYKKPRSGLEDGAGSWSLASLVPYVLDQAFAHAPHRLLPIRSSSVGSASSNGRSAARGAAQWRAVVALDVMDANQA